MAYFQQVLVVKVESEVADIEIDLNFELIPHYC
jgi:hypothetical protein